MKLEELNELLDKKNDELKELLELRLRPDGWMDRHDQATFAYFSALFVPKDTPKETLALIRNAFYHGLRSRSYSKTHIL